MIVGQLVKENAEEITVGVDFSQDLGVAETIVSTIVNSRNDATLLDTSATFLAPASPVIETPIVRVRCQFGLHGETHLVQIRAFTNLGNVYEHEVEVLVAEN